MSEEISTKEKELQNSKTNTVRWTFFSGLISIIGALFGVVNSYSINQLPPILIKSGKPPEPNATNIPYHLNSGWFSEAATIFVIGTLLVASARLLISIKKRADK
jgi:hypothetical protein